MFSDRGCPVKPRLYCGLMTQSGWPARLTHVIAGEVRRYRKQRKMSAQQLSERCTKLGLEISRSTIADLENGRRTALAVAELLILARALGVVPVQLLSPVGQREMLEVLPGQLVPTDSAMEWLTGEAALADADGGLVPVPQSPTSDIALYRKHSGAEREWTETERNIQRLVRDDRPDEAKIYMGRLGQTEEELRHLRALIRERELLLPVLPPGLTHIDDGEAS